MDYKIISTAVTPSLPVRELMRVFKDVGLVEQLGFGMSRILKAYDESNFEISEHFIKVIFPFSEKKIVFSVLNSVAMK